MFLCSWFCIFLICLKKKEGKGPPGERWEEKMQCKAETKKGSESSGEVYFTALGALEIYSVWSLALNADIKIITAVC